MPPKPSAKPSVSKPRQRAPKRMKTTPKASGIFLAQSQSHFDPLSLLAEAAFEYSQETSRPWEDKVLAERFLAQNGYGEISKQLVEAITSPENTSIIKTAADFVKIAQEITEAHEQNISLIGIFTYDRFAGLGVGRLNMIESIGKKIKTPRGKFLLDNARLVRNELGFSAEEAVALVKLPQSDKIVSYLKDFLDEFKALLNEPETSSYHLSPRAIVNSFTPGDRVHGLPETGLDKLINKLRESNMFINLLKNNLRFSDKEITDLINLNQIDKITSYINDYSDELSTLLFTSFPASSPKWTPEKIVESFRNADSVDGRPDTILHTTLANLKEAKKLLVPHIPRP